MICCPLTTQIKNYPFEVFIGGMPPNAVLADQVKSLDWHSRDAKPKGCVLPEQLAEVRAKIRARPRSNTAQRSNAPDPREV